MQDILTQKATRVGLLKAALIIHEKAMDYHKEGKPELRDAVWNLYHDIMEEADKYVSETC